MSTTGTETNITIPGSTFPRAGTYSFSVRAVNVLGVSDPLMADLEGMITNVSLCNVAIIMLLLVAVALTSVLSSSTVTMTSATLTFSLSVTCEASASVTVYYQKCADQISCLCPQDTSISTNERSTNATAALKITDLRAGVTYCYRFEVVNAGSIVGFGNGQMFTTIPPVPPALLGSARLVSSDPPTYQCVKPAMGFTPEIVAVFNSVAGNYSAPPCSSE